ncbi:MAG: Tab2 family RNA-binding protein [Cyanobacteriota bacterium]|nr:Tab2 family RNA-binding protein [Cyanobacteriota bacterium]
MIVSAPTAAGLGEADWEVDFYSRPVLEPDGRKRWDLLICATPSVIPWGAAQATEPSPFRFEKRCAAASVNSQWLREALAEALERAAGEEQPRPRRLRCWRSSMRPMVQRAAESLGLVVLPSRRCFSLIDWLRERERLLYPREEGYTAGPLAPPPQPQRPVALPWPEVVRGDRWSWATLPASLLGEAAEWSIGFGDLLRLPAGLGADAPVPGIRLFSQRRALALAGWLAGLEPVRWEVEEGQLVLEAGLDDRWRLATLTPREAAAAKEALGMARRDAAGLQFLAVQAREEDTHFEGFWMLRDLPDD